MYLALRKLLFSLDPELSHHMSLELLNVVERLKLIGLLKPELSAKPREIMGLTFANPVGLAAGLDKNGQYFNALGALGFGFVEIGTVTPRPQKGNPKPRLFRLTEQEAIINRMGFNNKGVDYLVAQVAKRRYRGVLGINIGKNKSTPEEAALQDYVVAMEKVYAQADYISINISSPNTPGLRNLQYGESLNALLLGISDKRKMLADQHSRLVPTAVKVAPDNDADGLRRIADALVEHEIDAVIATNTTISRGGVENSEHANEAGGLSGKPLRELATQTIATLKSCVGSSLPIIGLGGIASAEDAKEKLDAGADLVQLYTGFIYRGPKLIEEVLEVV